MNDESPQLASYNTQASEYAPFLIDQSYAETEISNIGLLLGARRKKIQSISHVDIKEVDISASPILKVSEVDNVSSLSPALAQNQQDIEAAGFSDDTYNRIVSLAYEQPSAGQSLNPVSLNKFLSFWLSIKESAKEPELFLCNNGNIQAEWYKNSKKQLIIEFGASLSICIFINGDKQWKQKEDISELSQSLKSHSAAPLKWA